MKHHYLFIQVVTDLLEEEEQKLYWSTTEQFQPMSTVMPIAPLQQQLEGRAVSLVWTGPQPILTYTSLDMAMVLPSGEGAVNCGMCPNHSLRYC